MHDIFWPRHAPIPIDGASSALNGNGKVHHSGITDGKTSGVADES